MVGEHGHRNRRLAGHITVTFKAECKQEAGWGYKSSRALPPPPHDLIPSGRLNLPEVPQLSQLMFQHGNLWGHFTFKLQDMGVALEKSER